MRYEREAKIATAGTNQLYIQLTEGSIIKVINTENATKGWQRTSICISDQAVARTICLLHKVTQIGLKAAHWEGSITMDREFNKIQGTFYGCDAGDSIFLVVGYEP